VAALALGGIPPLAGARADASEAPAPLGALIYGLAAPAAALGWLLRVLAALPRLPDSWATTLGLLGALGALACGAGALGERRLRSILAWAIAGQTSLVVAAIGLTGRLASVTGPSLLVGLMLAATVGAGAAATLERSTGSDDYTAGGATPPRVAGVVWAIAAAACLGLPPLWGFWPRLWLLLEAQRQQPWLLAPLLSGAVLLALALLAPLARLWGPSAAAGPLRAGWADLLPAALAGLPLLILGVAPGLAWAPWLQALPLAPDGPPSSQEARLAAIGAGLALIILGAAIGWAAPARTLERDPDEEPVRLAPEALGAALRPLAWLGSPMPLLGALWAGLQWMSEALRFLMGLFEQRYYLLGVLGALITIMLLMAQ
jgi:formate hydrogenlyase subunit 3/multisubunit Na+/H+ antiporter MnhD subunit